MSKSRVTVTLDRALIDEAKLAVRDGRSGSVSAFVARSIETQLAHDRRLAALGRFIAEHEAERGEISAQEIAEQRRADRDAAAESRGVSRRAG